MFNTLWNHPSPVSQWGMVLFVSALAMVWDVRAGRIPNVLVAPTFLSGVILAFIMMGLPGLVDSLAGAAIMFAPYFALFLFAGGGAGDAKLMAALGSWLGTAQGGLALGSVAGTGIVIGLAWAFTRGRFLQVLRNIKSLLMEAATCVVLLVSYQEGLTGHGPGHRDFERMPYAVTVFAGICLTGGGVWLWKM